MVSGLLDTSIAVDVLRGHPPARTWMAAQTGIGVSKIVWLEVLEGATNRVIQQRALRFMNDLELVPITVSDIDWAVEHMLRFNLSHNVDSFDCLIAAAGYRLQLPVYTTNLKHFTPLLGNLARKPY